MTVKKTGFELAPAGTAIPTTGVAGDGDAFTSGTNGTGTTFTSDSSIPGAVADGSLCGKITIPAAAATCWRGWGISDVGSGIHFRFYVYLTAYVAGNWDFAQLVHTTGGTTTIARARLNSSGQLVAVNNSTATATTTASIPLNQLVRIEGTWNVSAGTVTMDAYLGNGTTPISNLSISLTGQTFANTIEGIRMGFPTAGIANSTVYTDAWGVADDARLGPAVAGSSNVDKLKMGANGNIGLRVGSSTPSAVYLGSTKVWP